jgi:hypothetical protein
MKNKILIYVSFIIFLQFMFSIAYAQDITRDDIINNKLSSENVRVISGTLDDNIKDMSNTYFDNCNYNRYYDNFLYNYPDYTVSTDIYPDSTVYVYNNNKKGFGSNVLTKESLRVVDYTTYNDTLNVDKFTYSKDNFNIYSDGSLEEYRINYNSGYTNPVLDVTYVNDNTNELSSLQYNDYGNYKQYTTYDFDKRYQSSEVILNDHDYIITNVNNNSDIYDEFRQSNIVNDNDPLILIQENEFYDDGQYINKNINYFYYINGEGYINR